MSIFAVLHKNLDIEPSGLNIVSSGNSQREKLPETDLNNNNIPDWQETLEKKEIPLQNEATSSPTSLTEKASVELFADYLSIKGSGTLDTNSVETLAANFQNKNAPIQYEVYSVNDVKVSLLEDPSSLREYGNAIAKIRDFYALQFSLYNPSVKTQADPNSFWATAKEASRLYTEMRDELVAISVPKRFAGAHAELLNIYTQTINSLQDMSLSESDPLRGLQGLNLYLSLQEQEGEILIFIAQQLEESGILFGVGEPGYFFHSL